MSPRKARRDTNAAKTGRDSHAPHDGFKKPRSGRARFKARVPPLTWQSASVAVTASGYAFELPAVQSANRLWRAGNGRTFKSGKARTDASEARKRFGHIAPLLGDVAVRIVWVRERRAGDLDNKAKATLDILKGIAYHDDAAVVELHMLRSDDRSRPSGLYVYVFAADAPRVEAV